MWGTPYHHGWCDDHALQVVATIIEQQHRFASTGWLRPGHANNASSAQPNSPPHENIHIDLGGTHGGCPHNVPMTRSYSSVTSYSKRFYIRQCRASFVSPYRSSLIFSLYAVYTCIYFWNYASIRFLSPVLGMTHKWIFEQVSTKSKIKLQRAVTSSFPRESALPTCLV